MPDNLKKTEPASNSNPIMRAVKGAINTDQLFFAVILKFACVVI